MQGPHLPFYGSEAGHSDLLEQIYKEVPLQIFQKGILMSINSLTLLFHDLKVEFQISHITTHKLNQGALENLFTQVQSRGGPNDHPTLLVTLNRLRIIILTKKK